MIVIALLTLANLAVLGMNLKLYTEFAKQRVLAATLTGVSGAIAVWNR